MKKTILIITSLILGVIATIILACIAFYNVNLKAVSSESTEVDFMVDSGSTYYNVISNLSGNRANVVLLHDIKSITVGALSDIIKFGKEYGYEFSAIDMNTYMVRHSVNN